MPSTPLRSKATASHQLGSSSAEKEQSTLEPLMTARDVADRLQLHSKTVERMARAGRLPSLRVFGRLRFRPSDIASWLAEREDRKCHGC